MDSRFFMASHVTVFALSADEMPVITGLPCCRISTRTHLLWYSTPSSLMAADTRKVYSSPSLISVALMSRCFSVVSQAENFSAL